MSQFLITEKLARKVFETVGWGVRQKEGLELLGQMSIMQAFAYATGVTGVGPKYMPGVLRQVVTDLSEAFPGDEVARGRALQLPAMAMLHTGYFDVTRFAIIMMRRVVTQVIPSGLREVAHFRSEQEKIWLTTAALRCELEGSSQALQLAQKVVQESHLESALDNALSAIRDANRAMRLECFAAEDDARARSARASETKIKAQAEAVRWAANAKSEAKHAANFAVHSVIQAAQAIRVAAYAANNKGMVGPDEIVAAEAAAERLSSDFAAALVPMLVDLDTEGSRFLPK